MQVAIDKDVRYPRQIYSAKRETVILGIDNYLSKPDGTDKVPPLEMHSPFSRFVVTIIDKSGSETKTPKANIPAGDVPGIVEISKLVMLEKLRYESSSRESSEGDLSIGYTQQILIGGFRGKTPADILLENPDDREKLLNTRKFLADKATQYASNKKQVEAIDDAVALFDAGKLKKPSGAKRSGVVRVYDVDHKYMRDTNDLGHRLFYSMSIVCQFGNKYPWEITIENVFAPGLQGPKGGLVPKMDEKSSSAKCTFRMSDMEWSQLVNRIESDLRYFEGSCYASLYREAITIDNNRRKAARAQNSDGSGEAPTSKAA